MDFTSLANAFSTVVDAFGRLTSTVGKHFASSLMTVFMLFLCYAGYEAIQAGSVGEALKVLITSRETRLAQEAQAKAERMQSELRLISDSNQAVQRSLGQLLGAKTGAVRARYALIHNGIATLAAQPVLKWDVMSAAAIRGRAAGDLITNQPLSTWVDYLPTMINGQCAMVRYDALTDPATRARMTELGIIAFLACPVQNASGQMIGGLFLSWDDPVEIPADIGPVISVTRDAANRIGAAYDLRPLGR